MSEEDWAEATPAEMAAHVSIDGPKTDYIREKESEKKGGNKFSAYLLDRMDTLDPSLAQDMTSELLSVSKM